MTVVTILSNIVLFSLIVQALATKLQKGGYVFCIHGIFIKSIVDHFFNAYINTEI